MGDKGSPDLVNEFAQQREILNRGFDRLGGIMSSLLSHAQKSIRKEWKFPEVNGSDVTSNFNVMSMYVDNSNGSNPITVHTTNGGTFEIKAGVQQWVHPLGGIQFSFKDGSGATSQVPVMLVEQFLPIS